MEEPRHDDEFVRELFDRMGPSYEVTNLLSSFGFSEIWRLICVWNARIVTGSVVCDMMAGSGECWRYVGWRGGRILSVDFSTFMSERQRERSRTGGLDVEVRCENAEQTGIRSATVDHVVSAFGLKTLSTEAMAGFAAEIGRILKPGGSFSLLEISMPPAVLLRGPYRFYLSKVIPLVGKSLLGDIECYRMLGRYTEEFQSCAGVVPVFRMAGLEVELRSHFFGCATSLVGRKPRDDEPSGRGRSAE